MQVLKFTEIKKMYQPRGFSPINFMKLITRLHTIIAHLFWLQENYCKIHHNSFSGPNKKRDHGNLLNGRQKNIVFPPKKIKANVLNISKATYLS